MPVFKNESNGTWYVMARYVNWKGERKQKCKRLTDFQLAEIRQNLRADDMLLCQPCVLLQTGFHIPDIQFGKGFKAHIKVRRIL